MFSRLVLVDEHAVAARRRVRRDEVAGLSLEAAKFVDAFEKARLFVFDAAGSASVVEVAHEALLGEWPLLSTWIRERADDLRLMQQVGAAAEEWHRHSRESIYLWPHERLALVYQSLARLEQRREDLDER